jgi:hypothetical protein
MKFDLRKALGALFGIYGLLLTVLGFTTDTAAYERSLGLNVNLGLGVILLFAAAVLLWFAFRRRD